MNLQATSINIMLAINKLTPDIKNKAVDPDWFQLRQQIEQSLLNTYKAGMTEAADIALNIGDGVGACPYAHDEILSARDKKESL